MKKILSLILSAVFILLLASCGAEKKEYPLSVNGTPIDAEIFTCYLDRALHDPDGGATRADRITYATNMCIRYVALNSTFKQKGLTLSASDNVKCSNEANSLWARILRAARRVEGDVRQGSSE